MEMKTAICFFFFFNDTPTTEIYTLSLHDALPISLQAPAPSRSRRAQSRRHNRTRASTRKYLPRPIRSLGRIQVRRSEEHTSELQSRQYLVCRLLLEKKKQ